MTRRRVLAVFGGIAASVAAPVPCNAMQQPTKTALIIGNAHYAGAPLANTINDARLVDASMKALGFDTTTLLDATRAGMLDGFTHWLHAASAASVRMIYFAGHGTQYRGRNFLIPVDARLRSEDDLPANAFNVNDLIDRLSRFDTGVNVVVLDACRSIAALAAPADSRARGLAQVDPGLSATMAPRGTLVAYSTSPGAVAADNPKASNSSYTRHFVAHLRIPGLPIEAVFKRTRAAVLQESGGTQLPWESSSLVNDFCFTPNAAGTCG